MTRVVKTLLQSANIELLDHELKMALPVCYGITADLNGLSVILDDAVTADEIATALKIAAAHNPDDELPDALKPITPESLLAELDNAADMQTVIKALKYVLTRIQ